MYFGGGKPQKETGGPPTWPLFWLTEKSHGCKVELATALIERQTILEPPSAT